MPNLCENSVVIHGDKKKLDCLEQAAKRQAENEAFDQLGQDLLNAVIPVPDYLRNAEISNTFTVTDRTNWKIENWGTTYISDPIFNRQNDQTLELTFRSAWSPPLCVYQILVEDWGLEVKALFFEPLCCYAGIFENGKYQRFDGIMSNDTHELPKELRDAFGIESYLSSRKSEPETVNLTELVTSSNKEKIKATNQETITEEKKNEYIRRALNVLEYECRPRVTAFDWLYKIDLEEKEIPSENSVSFRRDVLAELGQVRNKYDLERIAYEIDKYKPADEDAIKVIREFRNQENLTLVASIQKSMCDFIRDLQSEQPNIKELDILRALQSLIADYETYTQYLSPLAMNQLKMANYLNNVMNDYNFEPSPPESQIIEEGYPFCGDLYD